MVIGGRAPNKILFARASGKVWQLDFFPSVRSGGSVAAALDA